MKIDGARDRIDLIIKTTTLLANTAPPTISLQPNDLLSLLFNARSPKEIIIKYK